GRTACCAGTSRCSTSATATCGRTSTGRRLRAWGSPSVSAPASSSGTRASPCTREACPITRPSVPSPKGSRCFISTASATCLLPSTRAASRRSTVSARAPAGRSRSGATMSTKAWIAAAVGAGAVIAPLGGAAQQAARQDEIVVVGTRGDARSALESPVPVDVIDAGQIARVESLGGELGELLQELAPSFNFPRQSNSGAADHVRAAQLRGMSPDHVLVLVNGKRQHTAAVVALDSKIGLGTNPFDFNTIPLSAIERIEILRDGAGAQYGSDAIAGVINIVLKSGEGGGATASYGLHRTDFDPIDDTITDGHTWSASVDYGLPVGAEGNVHFGAEYRDRSPTNRAGIGALPFFEEQTPANLALDPARVFAPGDGGSEDLYLWYNLTLPLGGRGFYSFARFASRDSEGTGFFRYPDGFTSNPAVHPNGFRPITLGENRDFSFTAGLEGHDFATDWDL